MFKISKMNDLSNISIDIRFVSLEIHEFDNGIKFVKNYDVPEFLIVGRDGNDEYSLSFKFNKEIHNLYNIELNTCVIIDEFIDVSDVYLGVNGIFDLDVTVSGKIYRIIDKNIIINMEFRTSDDYCGSIEIEFNMDDNFDKIGKSGIYEYKS